MSKIFYSPENFACKIDSNVLEFFSPVPDSKGKRGSAQIRMTANGNIVKDLTERYSSDQRIITWSDNIDDFVKITLKPKAYIAAELLSTHDVCTLLGVSRPTMLKYVKQGKIRPFKKEKGGDWFLKDELRDCIKHRIDKLNILLENIDVYDTKSMKIKGGESFSNEK